MKTILRIISFSIMIAISVTLMFFVVSENFEKDTRFILMFISCISIVASIAEIVPLAIDLHDEYTSKEEDKDE